MVRRTGVCALTRPRRAIALATAGFSLAISLALSGCSSDDDTKKASEAGGPKVVAPGKPGEPAKTLTADEARKARSDDSPNSADFSYIRMMIPHHQQALVMTELAARHADGEQVGRLAERISAAQGPEIDAMKGWLSGHGGPHAEGGHHHHGAMPGMATAAQLDQLRAARGEKFDALFLKLMIAHHQGAVSMATEVLSEGNNALVEDMANDVIAQQSAEIGRMARIRAKLRQAS
ncbi:DUF305 domain-containing protein [Streptomyces inhibens]|uniref:DUF305 domain-containing protein n=1 Tax=Streptomyces inhibens TaxID=2293571 RepID=A0A371PUY9_STRIH|nr:DUF305 domain-containing protein [Streptomyces inhibens]REK86277.1 DUF305 domain-containing protein [Streptomyces inhibens]